MADDTAEFAAEIIPTSYASWRYCIEVKCGIPLTPGYVEERLRVLADPGQEETQRFARTYGRDHLSQVLSWFRQTQAELGTAAR
ncbi:hypothetical protein CKO25_03655 [Thiocapsa imhoffii]|uniref:Uncharacterized protein n=1 Tax=Thiocapsa imhoffii TaxID=382777 RepID=A0A9X0WFK8_9GAMM|nr:hypothetical protein [Thiocapsa imhoffii]MBK1643767.1 hypothetical protein [Thiocapsa imhoffii]